jgi:hypothetical protein
MAPLSGRVILGTIAALAATASLAAADDGQRSDGRQALDGAWWTGPMLTPSPGTLPCGHFLIEPYFFDVTAAGRFGQDGKRRSAARSDGFGSLTYLLYGLTDKVTVGLIPTAGFNKVSDGPSSSGVGLGDVTVHAQYRLTQFREHSRLPAMAVAVDETLPTGKYDRLGDRPSDGIGSGAYTTGLAFLSQTYFWLPNGRILRMRVYLSQAISREVEVNDVSVYGTGAGFHGYAKPGPTFQANGSWEYSLTRSWVLAVDATFRRDGNTRVTGYDTNRASTGSAEAFALQPATVRLDSGVRGGFALAPAIEYSWTPNLGVLVGARVMAGGRNTAASITPAVAINFVH